MFFLGTADGAGRPQCSREGGDPGFLRVIDEHTLAFPNDDGNGMYLSLGNVLANPYVPRTGKQTPVPDEKRGDLAAGALPAGDPAAQLPEE